jgi:hypothetical protein
MPSPFTAQIRVRSIHWILSVLVAGLIVGSIPHRVGAHDDVCTWNGSVNARWDDQENWDNCNNGIPAPHDEVEISGGTFPPGIETDVLVKRLMLTGQRLNVGDGAVVEVTESFRSGGGASVNLNGTIRGPMAFGSGLTRISATGTLDGPITIGGATDPLATLDIADGSAIKANDDITINSALPGGGALGVAGGTGMLLFEGARFINNGIVREQLSFRRDGVQTVSGSGEWRDIPRLMITGASRTTLANSVTVSATNVDITNGGILELAQHTLTLRDTPTFNVELESAVDGSGMVRVDTNSILNMNGVMTPTLQLAPTVVVTVTATGMFTGDVVVPAGATLNVEGVPSMHQRIILDGAMVGGGGLVYRGTMFTNNGRVTIPSVSFSGTQQTLTGTGYFSATTRTTISAGARVSLDSAHRIGRLLITPQGTLDITDQTLILMGHPTPLVRHGTFTTTNSTVVYSSTVAQDVTTGVTRYHNLVLRNEAGTQQDVFDLHVGGDLTVERGMFTADTADILNVRINAGATLTSRPNTTITVRGDWTNDGGFMAGATSVVAFAGARAQSIGGSTITVFDGLHLVTDGTTLTTDAEVRRTISLDANLLAGDRRVTLPPAATIQGRADVVGTVRRTGPFVPDTVYQFNNPNVQMRFTNQGTLPSEASVTLALTQPQLLPQALQRTYTITPTGGVDYLASLRLRYLDDEVGARSEDALSLWRLDGAKQRWIPQGRTGNDTTQNWVELAGAMTGRAQWAIAPSFQVWMPLIRR